MKKFTSILLVLMLVLSMSTMAFADGTTTLTTIVPAATYTLNIPADQTIVYGQEDTTIGNVTVSNGSGFAVGKNVSVTLAYDAFTSSSATSTIPFYVIGYSNSQPQHYSHIKSGDKIIFDGVTSGATEEIGHHRDASNDADFTVGSLVINIPSSLWGVALAGEYTATITFTSEVVNG